VPGVLVRALPGVVVAVVGAGDDEVRGLRDVEGGIRGLGLHGIVDGRLEAGEVQDGLGLRQLGDGLRRELEVVRLGAGLGQRRHLDEVAADALRDELEGVEGGRDRHPVCSVGARRPIGAAVTTPGEHEGGGQDSNSKSLHDNHSQSW
jgi:hypothetical protein